MLWDAFKNVIDDVDGRIEALGKPPTGLIGAYVQAIQHARKKLAELREQMRRAAERGEQVAVDIARAVYELEDSMAQVDAERLRQPGEIQEQQGREPMPAITPIKPREQPAALSAQPAQPTQPTAPAPEAGSAPAAANGYTVVPGLAQ